jgi:3-phenylpropionate/cinnamic acid dioxygenase small subunit
MDDLELLLDEREITKLVLSYAEGLDTHDWESYRALFSEQVVMESNLRDTPSVVLEVDALVTRVKAQNLQFLLTLHYISNLRVEVTGDTATCTSYLYAQHVISEDTDSERFVAHGRYVHSMLRTPDGWRICGIAVTLNIRDGEPPTPKEASTVVGSN